MTVVLLRSYRFAPILKEFFLMQKATVRENGS